MTTVKMEEARGRGSAELDLAGGAWRPTATRREVNCPPQRYVGWMVGDEAVPAIRCWISDVNRSHARIRTFGSAALPDEFTLHFSRSGQFRVRCRVRRRTGHEAQVEFVAS